MTFVLEDSVDANQLDPGVSAVGYYADGRYANMVACRARCPHARLMPILPVPGVVPVLKDLVGYEHGVEIDIETTDWVPSQAAGFAQQAIAQGVTPHYYISLGQVPLLAVRDTQTGEVLGVRRHPDADPALLEAEARMTCAQLAEHSKIGELVEALASTGVARHQVKLRTAHWTGSPHICSGIATSHWGTISADATQWTDVFAGRNVDASLCADDFFASTVRPTPVPAPKPPHAHGTVVALVHHGVGDEAWAISPVHTGLGWSAGGDEHEDLAEITFDRRNGKWTIKGKKRGPLARLAEELH